MSIDAMKQALEALESGDGWRQSDAITALRAAIEQAERQEPPQFPTMLRKMWTGSEVQAWINENWSKT